MNLVRTILCTACLIALIWATGCAESPTTETSTSSDVRSDSPSAVTSGHFVHFEVGGMDCTGCAASIRHAVSKIEGVKQCTVSYEKASADIVIDADSDEDREAIIQRIIEKVTDDGFTIKPAAS